LSHVSISADTRGDARVARALRDSGSGLIRWIIACRGFAARGVARGGLLTPDVYDPALNPLGPLPVEPFWHSRCGERTAHLDGCVEVEAAHYGAPPGWKGTAADLDG
jgi:hypothetical protein